MATNPKILKLVRSLENATASGRLQWSESNLRDYFDLKMRQGIISISCDLKNGSEEYFVGLLGDDGRVIESEFFTSDDEGFENVRGLYQMVKRNAFHVDEILDSVIAELEMKAI
jgi:hypothetical protein